MICGEAPRRKRGGKWSQQKVNRYTDAIRKYLELLDARRDEIIHGGAPGVDTIAGDLAGAMCFKVTPFPADWKRYGLGAGPIRNRQMIVDGRAELVVAFHENLMASKGTANMIMQASRYLVPVKVNPTLVEV